MEYCSHVDGVRKGNGYIQPCVMQIIKGWYDKLLPGGFWDLPGRGLFGGLFLTGKQTDAVYGGYGDRSAEFRQALPSAPIYIDLERVE